MCSIALPASRFCRIEERPVEVGNVPGEWYSKTQPFPSSRRPTAATASPSRLDRLHAGAARPGDANIVTKYKIGPVFTPPVVSNIDGPLMTLTLGTASGGTNWPGASFDPETHTVYAYACNACLTPISW